jgi:hypothetical protein
MAIPLTMKMYRYRVDAFDILLGGETTKVLPTQINSIIIEKDFDSDFFPGIRVNLSLDTELYHKVIANKTSVRFRMRLQKHIYNRENKLTAKSDVFNDIFCIYLDEDTPFLDQSSHEEAKKVTDVPKSPEHVGGGQQELFLFKEKDIVASQKVQNVVLQNINMSNTIAYILSGAGVNNVLMSPMENTTTYPEVLIPPYTLLGAINHLEAHFGFYKNGTVVFFDTDRVYFLKRGSTCTAWVPQEYKKTVFHIKKTTNPDSLSPGSYDDAENKNIFINVVPNDISMSTPSVLTDVLHGNNVIVVTPSTGKFDNINPNTVQVGSGSYSVMVDPYANPYAVSAETYQRNEASYVAQVTLGDYDIAAITPNKEFMFTFEDASINSTYGGGYRISKSISTFTKQGEEFSISGQHTFNRIKR